MINYPNSACEKHKSVSTSEPVCIICMSNQITELELENSALKDGLEVQNDALHAKLIEVEEEVVRLNKEIDLRHRIHIDLCDTINPERDAPAKDAAIALHAKLKAAEELNVDYEECNADRNRLVREIDTIINGDNAAKQASLCDLVSVIRELVSKLTDAEVRIAKLDAENDRLADMHIEMTRSIANKRDLALARIKELEGLSRMESENIQLKNDLIFIRDWMPPDGEESDSDHHLYLQAIARKSIEKLANRESI